MEKMANGYMVRLKKFVSVIEKSDTFRNTAFVFMNNDILCFIFIFF